MDTTLRIHFLGTGSASPNKDRGNSSLLLDFDATAVLVDASGYPGQSIPRTGVGFAPLHDVILTHAHVDHLYALPSLLSSVASFDLSGTPRVLRLHGLPETLDVARHLLEIFIAPSKSMGAMALEYHELHPDPLVSVHIDTGWAISAFRVNHGGIPAIGLNLTHPDGRTVIYSGDAVADECMHVALPPDATCLIHDCASGLAMTPRTGGHAGAAELSLLLQARQPRETYITHLSARQDAVLPQMLDTLAQGYMGSVSAAYDGLVLTF
jgi:ribonuclease Z